MKIAGYAELTRCECSEGGHIIAWRAVNSAYWHMALDAVRSLPPHERSYLPDERAWWVNREGFNRLGAEVFSNFHHARRVAEAPAPPVMPAEVAQAFAVLHVTPDAPAAIVQAAYRVLARICHPDAGGDELRMKRINAAYETARAWAEQHAA